MGIFVIIDYILFSILLQLYNVYIIVLILALCSGLGVLFSLNTILSLFATLKKATPQSNFRYRLFVQVIITIVAGTLMTIPGIISSVLGWVLYLKPVRLLLVNILYRHIPKIFRQLYSYFLAEYM